MHKNFLNSTSAVIKPKPLSLGDTIGIFSPSWPAHTILREKYLHGLKQIKKAGFEYLEGSLTKNLSSEGYRTANAKLRALELMELLCQPQVKCLMATIGGWNSSSLIPYLDFEQIRKERKIICGYSDTTSLQLAILKYSQLSTLYGPTVVPVFGEYPSIFPYALASFLTMTSKISQEQLFLSPPYQYSTQFVDGTDKRWKQKEANRHYQPNEGWQILSEGRSSGQLIVANLETLLSLCGTSFFPSMKDKILVLEEEEANLINQEKAFVQLLQMGIFNQICGLLISKPFSLVVEGFFFSYEELILEIIGKVNYPIIINFDCGHAFPSLSLPIGIQASLEAFHHKGVYFSIDENSVNF